MRHGIDTQQVSSLITRIVEASDQAPGGVPAKALGLAGQAVGYAYRGASYTMDSEVPSERWLELAADRLTQAADAADAVLPASGMR